MENPKKKKRGSFLLGLCLGGYVILYLLIGLLTILFRSSGSSATESVTAASPVSGMQVELTCNHRFRNGTCVSVFSWTNDGPEVSLPIGATNYVHAGSTDHGQPTVFPSGQHFGAAHVSWNCRAAQALTWTLGDSKLVIPHEHDPCPAVPETCA